MSITTSISKIKDTAALAGRQLSDEEAEAIYQILVQISHGEGRHGNVNQTDIEDYFKP